MADGVDLRSDRRLHILHSLILTTHSPRCELICHIIMVMTEHKEWDCSIFVKKNLRTINVESISIPSTIGKDYAISADNYLELRSDMSLWDSAGQSQAA